MNMHISGSSELKYLMFQSGDRLDSKFGCMFPADFSHDKFAALIIDNHPFRKDLKVVSGGFIKYDEETKSFLTVGKSISCRVSSDVGDIIHFALEANRDDW